MIYMQRGEARDFFLAGAAHDGDGVLSSSFQRQSRVVPPVLKGEIQTFKHEFLLKANILDISGHFVGQRVRVVPVGGPLRGQCCCGKAFQGRKSEGHTKRGTS